MRSSGTRILWSAIAMALLFALAALAWSAPDFLSTPQLDRVALGPLEAPPFGTDERGIALLEYAAQGAAIVVGPALAAGALVMLLSTLAGLVRCAGMTWIDWAIQAASELVGSLPRLVVILVAAMMLPALWDLGCRAVVASLFGVETNEVTTLAAWAYVPSAEAVIMYMIGTIWALLAAPGAMDEAASTAGRLGGERFVEALRAHGFSGVRIYLIHVVWLNLRAVIVRQGAEVMMHVVFLEIALSYLALRRNEPSFTHADSEFSWATLLYQGYTALLGADLMHALWLGLGLVAMTAAMAQAFRLAARAR